MTLNNIKKIPIEIAYLLASDKELQKLLIIDESDIEEASQTFQPLSVNEILEKEYVSIAPSISYGFTNSSRNTSINIGIDEISFEDDRDISVRIEIFCATDKDHALLKDNRLRLLEIIDRISLLDGVKISAAGALNFQYASSLSFSEHLFGYKLVFDIKDQEVRKAEL